MWPYDPNRNSISTASNVKNLPWQKFLQHKSQLPGPGDHCFLDCSETILVIGGPKPWCNHQGPNSMPSRPVLNMQPAGPVAPASCKCKKYVALCRSLSKTLRHETRCKGSGPIGERLFSLVASKIVCKRMSLGRPNRTPF